MRLIPPLLALLLGCVLHAEPFGIQVLDDVTGRGVPLVSLETVNGIRLVSDSAGWIAFDEPGLMRQRVHFLVSSPGYSFAKDSHGVPGVALITKPGIVAEVRLLRLNLAERLYRITGQGIYRDSTLLKKDEPLPSPNLAGSLLSQGDAQVAGFHGKLFWVWGDTRRASHPQTVVHGTSATSELPGSNGLDPTQGVHFQYSADELGEPVSVLQGREPGSVRLEGLLSVKDSTGADHLVAHYARIMPDGKAAEHGIAELGEGHQFERLVVLGDDYTWQFPQGHAVQVTEGKDSHFYFAMPFAHVRVPARYEAMLTPSNYEALAWDDDHGEIRWQKARPPMSASDEERWIDKRMIKAKEARCRISTSADPGHFVVPTSGTIAWNGFRKSWIFIFSTSDGGVFCARAPAVDGPWQKAVLIAIHPGHQISAVGQIPAFDQEDGRLIYFQGTLDGGTIQTPRYDGNALMYRLDLGDPRLDR